MIDVRQANKSDAPDCAAILNEWIDSQDWMPRMHSADDVVRHYRDFVFAKRKVFVAGDAPEGFLALDEENGCVTALYAACSGQGIGKALLDQAKLGRDALELWTFAANTDAQRFYAREGFSVIRETDGDNEESLPDILLRWDRTAIRMATKADVPIIARIVNDWVDRTPWMPPSEPAEFIEGVIAKALPEREIFLIGDPVEGYLSLNPETGHIGALYTDRSGDGLGKALMDRAKSGRDYLQLWTHELNEPAHRFYAREGFTVVERKAKGDDGLPELRMEWRR